VATTTINGANVAAITSGAATGSMIEATGVTPGTRSGASADNPPSTFAAVRPPTTSDFGYGAFTMTAAGVWTYALDNNNFKMDALAVGDAPTDHFTMTGTDGTAQVIAIPVHSADDSAAPNELQNLALGPAAIADAPKVHGTPHGETIADAGDAGQIVRAGAGNDAFKGNESKGNESNDTSHVGSGNDTVNGNNGNHTIVDGFGANQLSGGNGSDRCTYLPAAHANPSQFDAPTDFKSGSDKIDLTALGALGYVILALNSTSTSVPPHTIAWLYDGSANETIVYVNPTDHALRIGDSSLLEIHLQGVASIESSDFIFDAHPAPPVTANELDPTATTQSDPTVVTSNDSSGATVGDSLADNSTTAQTIAAAFLDQNGWLDHPTLSGSSRIATSASDAPEDDPVVVSAGSPPSISQHAHDTKAAEPSITSAKLAALDFTPAITVGEGGPTVGNGPSPDLLVATPNLVHDVAEQPIKHESPLHSGDNDHGLPPTENTDSAAHNNHGHAGDDSPDDTSSPGPLKTAHGDGPDHSHSNDATDHGPSPSENAKSATNSGGHAGNDSPGDAASPGSPKTAHGNGPDHSPSSDATEHGNGHGHDAAGTDPPAGDQPAPASAAADPHGPGDSFHFKDTSVAHGSDIETELKHPASASGHHEHADGSQGVETTTVPEVSLSDIVQQEPGHTTGVHVHHDLIV
jgi:VCBS repeat-containing protein